MSETISDAMTTADLAMHAKALAARLGGNSYVNISAISDDGRACLSLYPDGICGRDHRVIRASTWPDVIQKAHAWIATNAIVHRDATIRKMALAIIEMTDDHGNCTAAMLERQKFSADQIAEFHEAACRRASEMCASAPFRVEFGA